MEAPVPPRTPVPTDAPLSERRAHAVAELRALHTRTRAELDEATSRDDALVVRRRLDVYDRVEAAIAAHAPAEPDRLRVVLGTRQDWFRDKTAAQLAEAGARLVLATANGAELVGAGLAEQPDLAIVEDGLTMVSSEAVVRYLRSWSPSCVVVAKGVAGRTLEDLLAAGAHVGLGASTTPDAVVRAALEAVNGPD